MKIIVCTKQVPDTRGDVIFSPNGTLNRAAMLAIMNPDDKTGLEATLRLGDELGTEVTVLTTGLSKAIDTLREAYAMGADEMVLATGCVFDGAGTWATSSTITAVLRNLEHDLIITNRQAIDGDTAQVGPQIAKHLGLPVVSYMQDLKIGSDCAIMQRQFEDRYHVLKVKLPCLCTALAELNPPRYITVDHLFNTFDQDVTTWSRKGLPTLEDKDMGPADSPTRIARASDKVKKGKSVRMNLDTQGSVKYLMDQLVEKHVIQQNGKEVKAMNLEEYKGVYIPAKQVDGKVSNIAYELIGEAENLAEALKADVTAVLVGSSAKDEAEKLGAYGADRVILVDNPALKEYRIEPYTHAPVEVTNRYKPEIVLVGATPIGRSLSPSTSARVATGLTADCTKFEIGDFPLTVPAGKRDTQKHNQLLMARPAFGGNTIATIAYPNNRPQMAAVRLDVMQKRAKEDGRKFELVEFNPDFTPNKRCVGIFEVVKKVSDTIDIINAKILVSGGRSAGSTKNFRILDELAEILGGEVSCSRAVVDVGWRPQALQVGQTGKTVHPQLYFATGISSTIQHLAGVKNSDLIIAINKDEDAPVFDVVDIGIVGDLSQIVPALIKQIANCLATKKQ